MHLSFNATPELAEKIRRAAAVDGRSVSQYLFRTLTQVFACEEIKEVKPATQQERVV